MIRRLLDRGLVLAAIAGLVGSCRAEAATVLECSIDVSDVIEVLVLAPENERARMLRSEWNPIERVGSFDATEYRFDVTFPGRASQAELQYRIDRRTLQANRWFVDDAGEPYLDVEATCRSLPGEPEA